MAKVTARVVQILGGVVDVEFPDRTTAEIYEALEVPREGSSHWSWKWKNIWAITGCAV